MRLTTTIKGCVRVGAAVLLGGVWALSTTGALAATETAATNAAKDAPAAKSDTPAPEAQKAPLLKAQGEAGKLSLQLEKIPAQSPNGQPVAAYRVYRRQWPAGETAEAKALTFELGEVAPKADGSWSFVDDKKLENGTRYDYHLYPVNAAKALDVKGELVLGPFVFAPPLNAPKDVTAKSGDGSISISYTPADEKDAKTLGLIVYRADSENSIFNPLTQGQLQAGTSFVDAQVRGGDSYRYRARLAHLDSGVLFWGPLSAEITAKAVDTTPPPAPEVTAGAIFEGGVLLTWKPVADAGLLGYHVERRTAGGKTGFARVSEFITVEEFTDRTLPGPGSYVYRVEARDKSGNAALSKELPVTYSGEAGLAAGKAPEAKPAAPAPAPVKAPEAKPEPVLAPSVPAPTMPTAPKAPETKPAPTAPASAPVAPAPAPAKAPEAKKPAPAAKPAPAKAPEAKPAAEDDDAPALVPLVIP